MEQSDIGTLRDNGLTDEQVLSTVAITSYFNFMNRLADSLGVEIPEGRQEIMADWLAPSAKQARPWLLNVTETAVPSAD